jgi:hypothetical protein
VSKLDGETPCQIKAWSLIRNEKKTIVLFDRHCHGTEKSKAIACARRCRSSRLKRGGGPQKNNWKNWRTKEEEKHKESLTPHPPTPPPKKTFKKNL